MVLDEFPTFIHKLRIKDAQQAMELCDLLRELRHEIAEIRLIFAGSAGLHLVLDELKAHGYRNEPVNDMEELDLPPLEGSDGIELARRLLQGAEIQGGSDALAMSVAQTAECIPYYIHRIVFEMEKKNNPPREWKPHEVGILLDELIRSVDNPLELDHYRNRIRDYFPAQSDQQAIFTILEILGEKDNPIALTDLLDTLLAALPSGERMRLAEIIGHLERDHYLRRSATNEVGFASRILKNWFRHHCPGSRKLEPRRVSV